MTRTTHTTTNELAPMADCAKRHSKPGRLALWLAPWICAAAHAAAPLPAPTIISAIPGIDQVTLKWSAVDGATAYNVYVSATNGDQGSAIKPGTSATQYSVRDLPAGTPYYFTVTALSKDVLGTPSKQVAATPADASTARVLDLAPVVGGSAVTLTWTDIGANSYEIDEGTDPATVPTKPVDTVAATGGTTLTDTITGLTSPGTYYFVVHTVFPGGDGPASAPVSAVVAATKTTATASSSPLAFFQTGVSLLNPYHITTTAPVTVSPASGTDTNAFLEFFYTNRLAWNEQRLHDKFPTTPIKSTPKWYWPGRIWDVQTRIAYTFTSSGTKSASTIVGSGNFDGELSVDLPFVIVDNAGDVSDYTVGPVLGYTAVTDRSALKSHQSLFGGISYATALVDPLGDKDSSGEVRRILLEFRLVYARLDTVRYVSASSTEIDTTNGTLPRYFQQWSTGFESELLYPLNKDTYVTFRGQIYPNLTPGLWSIQIGFSTPFSSIFGSFFK